MKNDAVFIRCKYVPNSKVGLQRITVGNIYLLVEISSDYFRVINDAEEPVLYPKKWFVKIEEGIPHWNKITFDDGEYFCCPAELSGSFFFEKWFDGDSTARNCLSEYIDSRIKK